MPYRLCLTVLGLLLVISPVRAAEPGAVSSYEPGQTDVVAGPSGNETMPAIDWAHPEVETRGVWMTSTDLFKGQEHLAQQVEAMAEAGLNTVLVNIWFRGFVAYPDSDVVPQYPQLEGTDHIGFVVDQAHQRGMRVQFWPEYGFYAYYTPDATVDPSMGPILDANPDLLSIDLQGRKYLHNMQFGDYYSICPSNPRSHEILATMYTEAVTRYPVDGLNLDRIRYAAEGYCYCDYCREHFEADTGLTLREFEEGSEGAQRWLDWKREQTAKAVEVIVEAVRQARPGLPVTAYVVGPDEMNSRAQGWDLWIERDLLDAVAVSMYGPKIDPVLERALQLLDGANDKLICAISSDQPTPMFLRNIHTARQANTLGQFIWYLGSLGDDYQALEAGPYAEPAASPWKEGK